MGKEAKRNSYAQDVNAGIKPAGVGAANNKPNAKPAKKAGK